MRSGSARGQLHGGGGREQQQGLRSSLRSSLGQHRFGQHGFGQHGFGQHGFGQHGFGQQGLRLGQHGFGLGQHGFLILGQHGIEGHGSEGHRFSFLGQGREGGHDGGHGLGTIQLPFGSNLRSGHNGQFFDVTDSQSEELFLLEHELFFEQLSDLSYFDVFQYSKAVSVSLGPRCLRSEFLLGINIIIIRYNLPYWVFKKNLKLFILNFYAM
ncbi:MAG: hypothetical protein Hyperionvirus12_24 [Hyperionvirus sp.]|uniref:Uncharacterized protein n=1 Tax=Hyperionvirus sp. TaxID=2487770 RepID=A0A3G5A985_9VIRU|nr:MAG: hypothetical protein Hyperionvirus12_24 [Hyperionvirus sp.]